MVGKHRAVDANGEYRVPPATIILKNKRFWKFVMGYAGRGDFARNAPASIAAAPPMISFAPTAVRELRIASVVPEEACVRSPPAGRDAQGIRSCRE